MTEIPDWLLDWEHVDYWQDCDYSRGCGVEFVCRYATRESKPDARCKSGMRSWWNHCNFRFRDWCSLRDLIEQVERHVKDVHPECENPH